MSNFGGSQDYGRIQRRPYRRKGLDRQQRLYLTLGVGAAVLLILGLGVGFAVGRATAPEPKPAAPAAQPETTMPAGIVEEVAPVVEEPVEEVVEESAEETETVDEEAPPTPKQTAPKDGARIDAARVYLKWRAVEDDSEEPVTYAFEIQDRLSTGKYGNTQVITGLKETKYSARVLYVKRRWRVWAIDAAGNKSDKSDWRHYQHTPRPKKSSPKPSDETT